MMNRTLNRRRAAAALMASLGTLALAPAALAQAPEKFPSRVVRIVVPFAAGGPGDILARTLSTPMSETLGQQVIVDNRAGGDAIPGTQFAAKAAPDGYTILQVASTQVINMVMREKAPYDLAREFTPIARVGETALVLVVPATAPNQSVKDLIAYAKARPGSISYASGAVGSAGHLAAELFKSGTGVAAVHVPYKGNSAAMADLVGGRIDFAFQTPSDVITQIQGGRLRALAVTTPKRVPSLPDVPTMAEAGFRVVNPTVNYGYLAPRGTPDAVVRQLQEAFVKALTNPAVLERLATLGISPNPGGPADLADTLRQETERWSEVVKRANIRGE